MDADGDGTLTFREFERFWREHRPLTSAPSSAESDKLRQIFDLLDRDGSNQIDRREVLSAFQNDESVTAIIRSSKWLQPLLKPSSYSEMFISMDLDGDGKVTFEECACPAIHCRTSTATRMQNVHTSCNVLLIKVCAITFMKHLPTGN